MSTLHAIILAAGRGTRMGGPKLTMTVGGRPWWMTQAERLARAGVTPFWVVALSTTPPPLPGSITTADSDSPMFASVRAGLRAWIRASGRDAQGVFLLPIDTPVPRAEVWDALRTAACAANAPAAPCQGDLTGHPLFLPANWVDRVLAADPAARLDHITRDPLVRVPTDDRDAFTNLNTPEALAEWVARSSPPT